MNTLHPETPIGNTFADAFQQQSMMNCIEVTGEITFDHSASRATAIVTVLQLQLDRTYRMVNAAGGSETIGSAMEITLPDRFHGHQHRPLYNPIPQTWDTQGPQLAVRLRYVPASCRSRPIGARQQFD